MAAKAPKGEKRSFTLHPAIIRSIIREQAGTISKAFAELIMNSVDAGATKVEITITGNTFCVSDDGRGFSSRHEIEEFFEKFGAPHEEGDARFGKFRIGRGQIMAFASTRWRSGNFEMAVDFGSDTLSNTTSHDHSFFGYDLIDHKKSEKGCRIEGEFYHLDYRQPWELGATGEPQRSHLAQMIKYLDVPVILNGVLINTPPSQLQWDIEDQFAWYRLDRNLTELNLYNQGIYVSSLDRREFGTGGVVVSKKNISLNMARNQLLDSCPVWRHIYNVMIKNFNEVLGTRRSMKLTPQETAALLIGIYNGSLELTIEQIEKLRETKFIPDIFGRLRTPKEMLSGATYTLYDGLHEQIGERIQTTGMAAVFMPAFLQSIDFELIDNELEIVIDMLTSALLMNNLERYVIPFEEYVASMESHGEPIHDNDLTPDELVALNALKKVNTAISRLVNGYNAGKRKLLAGRSDTIEAWTDGVSYICINREQLKANRTGANPTKLISLLAHEYSHLDSSLGEHSHGLEFYMRFHEAVIGDTFNAIVLKYMRAYMDQLIYAGVAPAASFRSFSYAIADSVDNLRDRRLSKPTQDFYRLMAGIDDGVRHGYLKPDVIDDAGFATKLTFTRPAWAEHEYGPFFNILSLIKKKLPLAGLDPDHGDGNSTEPAR